MFFLFEHSSSWTALVSCYALCDTGAGGCWLVILDSFRQLEYFLFVHRFNIFLNTSFQFSLIHGRFVCVLEVELPVTGTHSPFQKKKKERKNKEKLS
jgi:hypothetical protein